MKSKIELNIDVSDPFKTVLTNSSGDVFTFTNSQHEGFCDFLQGAEKLPIKRVSYCDLDSAKIGDKIIFSKVFKQSKRYTVGVEYEFIKVKNDSYRNEIAVRDDRGKLAWISRHGISFSEYKILSCS